MDGGLRGRRERHPDGAMTLIAKSTGALECDGFRLEPGMQESALLDVAPTVKKTGSHGAWSHYGLQMGDWSVMATFRSARLRKVSLAHFEPEEPTSWSTWSVEREQERKLTHDKFLTHWLGWSIRFGRCNFRWGSARSERDPKTGDACIVISYEY